jgi:hypothetical protein
MNILTRGELKKSRKNRENFSLLTVLFAESSCKAQIPGLKSFEEGKELQK